MTSPSKSSAIVGFLLGLALVGSSLAGAAGSPAAQYVRSWAPEYRTFARVYVDAYTPCLKGATASCAAAQARAASAARKTVAVLTPAKPPVALAHDIAELLRDLRAADRTLSASAVSARAGNTSERHWCSAEQGPCTVVMIDLGNVIGDINFVAKVDLPLPA